MKSRGAPPPSGAAPAVSREIVNIVKKKLSAPSSAPPASMKSITNRGTAYRGIDEDDEDDEEVEEASGPKEEEEPRRSNGAKGVSESGSDADIVRNNSHRNNVENELRRNIGAKDSTRGGSDVDNVRTIDHRTTLDSDERSTSSKLRQGSFHQPRRAPYRQHHTDDDDDDDEGSFDYESDDHSAYGKGNKAPPKIDPRDRQISIPTNFSGGTVLTNPLERSKTDNRDRDNNRDRERSGDRDRDRDRDRERERDRDRDRDRDRKRDRKEGQYQG